MEKLNTLFELISGKDFTIPLWEMMTYIMITSLCLLFGKHRLGLLTAYCFVFYWGFVSNLDDFFNINAEYNWELPIYVISGFLMFSVALISFFIQAKD